MAVKDLFDITGYPTSGGQPLILAQSGIKTRTAPTIQRLLDAGARFIGKTITDELAFSMAGNNVHFGAPINGAAPDRICGGSSSGSASAVSHGLCDFAIGTDTGGSVRAPANHCGLIGLRPTHARISLEGCMDLSPGFDSCGWFAKDIETFSRVGDVLLGEESHPIANPRLIDAQDVWALLGSDVAHALKTAKEKVIKTLGGGLTQNVAHPSFDQMSLHFRYLQGAQAWQTDGAFIEKYSPNLGPGVADRFAWSKTISAEQVRESGEFQKEFRSHLAKILGKDGVLVLPTMPDIAPLRSTPESAMEAYRSDSVRMLCIAGLSGFPQISLPMASRLGAPLGISLLGPAGSDKSLIQMAKKILLS